MKRFSTIFLQGVVCLIGIVALIAMIREPLTEGRNIHATLFETYSHDPFLAYVYIASIAFFVALYQAFSLLRLIGSDRTFSPKSGKALRTIQNCAMTLCVLVAAPVAYLMIVRPGDDIAGGVAVGLFILFSSATVVAAANVLEKLLQSAIDMKTKHD